MENMLIRNIMSKIKRGGFNSQKEISAAVDQHIQELKKGKEVLFSEFNKTAKCSHEYGKPTFTAQKRLIGYITVYKRKCTKCDYCETCDNGVPEWGGGASQAYYNNNL